MNQKVYGFRFYSYIFTLLLILTGSCTKQTTTIPEVDTTPPTLNLVVFLGNDYLQMTNTSGSEFRPITGNEQVNLILTAYDDGGLQSVALLGSVEYTCALPGNLARKAHADINVNKTEGEKNPGESASQNLEVSFVINPKDYFDGCSSGSTFAGLKGQIVAEAVDYHDLTTSTAEFSFQWERQPFAYINTLRTRDAYTMIMREDGSKIQRVFHSNASQCIVAFEWSPDYRYLISNISNDSYLCWQHPERLYRALDPQKADIHIASMPDGDKVSYVGPGIYPSWSPDSKRIVYMCNYEGKDGICRIDIDTISQKPTWLGPGKYPYWSPQGDVIAFVTIDYETDPHEIALWVMDINGSKRKNLLKSIRWFNGWSPDGTHLAVQVGEDVYVMESEGTSTRKLISNFTGPMHWSPDGQQILFAEKQNDNSEIFLVSVDGTRRTNLTNNKANDNSPVWSPDGNRIAFISDRDGNDEIYVMNADGTGAQNFTRNGANERRPEWSPDGGKILYYRIYPGRENWHRTYIMNADDGSEQKILLETEDGWCPRWRANPEPYTSYIDFDACY